MDPTLTDPGGGKEQRLLAAIVFTDVVGFSRLAAKNEARVYVALQRDMGVMTDLCRAHGGQVLNTMGDGMLMCFPSAVDAMACAVEIQRTLSAQGASLPPSDVLHHRIGVHLGDVIVKGDNVFGDGVNTAARLQNDARPDSIWFSHTVHEVIKNKLKIDAKHIGPRQFKNLGEPVKVWEVPPVAEIRAKLEADAAGLGSPAMHQESDGVAGGRALLLVLASLLMVGAVVFLITRMKPTAEKQTPRKSTGGRTNKPATGTTGTNVASTTGETTGTQTTATTPTLSIVDAQKRIDDLKRTYSFAEIAQFLAAEGAVIQDARAQHEKYQKLDAMKQWMEAAIQTSSASDPITVQLSGGEAKIFNQPPTPMVQLNGGDYVPFQLTTLAPSDYLALAKALEPRPSSQTPGEAGEWIMLFATEYPGS